VGAATGTLAGREALVTGAARGLGRGYALRLAEIGRRRQHLRHGERLPTGDPDAGTGDQPHDRSIEHCVRVVEFLVTDLSDYVTGCTIPIAGGLLP